MSSPARLARAAIVVLLDIALASTLTASECQDAITGAGTQLLERSLAAQAACREGVARGKLPARTDCLVEATTRRKLAAAAAKMAKRVREACADAAVARLGLGGDCTGVRTATGLVACLLGSHEADAATLIAVADATRGPLSVRAQACEAGTSRQARRYALARLDLLQRCKRRPPLERLPPGVDCSAEPRTARRIVDLRARAAGKIVASCDVAALAETPFGAPCGAPGSSRA